VAWVVGATVGFKEILGAGMARVAREMRGGAHGCSDGATTLKLREQITWGGEG